MACRWIRQGCIISSVPPAHVLREAFGPARKTNCAAKTDRISLGTPAGMAAPDLVFGPVLHNVRRPFVVGSAARQPANTLIGVPCQHGTAVTAVKGGEGRRKAVLAASSADERPRKTTNQHCGSAAKGRERRMKSRTHPSRSRRGAGVWSAARKAVRCRVGTPTPCDRDSRTAVKGGES